MSRVLLLGAGGFLGGVIARELREAGVDVRTTSGDLTALGPGDWARELDGADAVVNAAGPFALWGEPVVRAATAAGCHYVDTAGEQGYIRHVLDAVGPDAATRPRSKRCTGGMLAPCTRWRSA